MSKIIASTVLLGLSLFFSYYAMVAGWGLTVHSWPALIAGYVGGVVCGVMIGLIKDE